MSLLEAAHGGYVHRRRVRVLRDRLSALIPAESRLLDVGSGDGLLAYLIGAERPDVEIEGVDVLVRDRTRIPVRQFDGLTLPYGEGSFDVVMLVDVLHHCPEPMGLLREAARVSRGTLLLKDHLLEGWLAEPTLRFMDRVGNRRHGVALETEYWRRQEWLDAFARLGLTVDVWSRDLKLYPAPLSWIFGRSLHFICRLRRPESAAV